MYYIGSMPVGRDNLAHYGVKGMKWGVRRSPEELGYKPIKGERGDSVQRSIARKTNKYKNRIDKANAKTIKIASKGLYNITVNDIARLQTLANKQDIASAKSMASMHMQQVYSKLDEQSRKGIRAGHIVSRVLMYTGNIGLGLIVSSAAGKGRLKRMAKDETYNGLLRKHPDYNEYEKRDLRKSVNLAYR